MRLLPLAAALGAASITAHGSAAAPDPAARGLDAFLATAPTVWAGGTAMIQVETFGFATTTTPAPLGGVVIEAAWDPQSLESFAVAPPPVKITSERGATATLAMPVPEGDDRNLTLLVALRFGEHSRTRTLTVHRRAPQGLLVGVADRNVVPGTTVATWAHAYSNASGAPIQGAHVRFSLLEGTYARHVVDAVTDPSGYAVAKLPIPQSEDPTWSWTLVAALDDQRVPHSSITLSSRDETPGEPTSRIMFDAGSVGAGKVASYRIALRDGSGVPIANQTLRVWTGVTGTKAPASDGEWEKITLTLTTDGAGIAAATVNAPTVTNPDKATRVEVAARVVIEGKALNPTASIPVGDPRATIDVIPEGAQLVPGLTQSVFFRLRDDRDKGIAGEILVEGDGLHQKLVTNERGEGELRWAVPKEIGAHRDVGPCASGVAATLRMTPLGALPALGPVPHLECVRVDRERSALLHVDRPMVRVGEEVKASVDVVSATKGAAAAMPTSFSVEPPKGQRSGGWSATPSSPQLALGGGAPGLWTLTSSTPRVGAPAITSSAGVFVLPKVLPRLSLRTTMVRAVPDGEVELEASLTDEAGKPIAGSGQAVLVDLEGGGTLSGLEANDTRRALCASVGIEDDLCDAFLSDDKSLDPLRREVLYGRAMPVTEPASDPGATAKAALSESFGSVLRSLEGALFEATSSPNRLMDVKRKTPGGLVFNPELLTLTTGAMSTPPTTPGGEVFALPDLLAVDPQVTFDNVARRVTRLKLFRVLSAVRTFKRDGRLDDDEPIWKDPNALLRRMVRDGTFTDSSLLDPWGGTMQFVPGQAALPFISAIRGWTLSSPGPDGVLGSGDDIRDPFVRVVKSGTPYAIAMHEDELVDAKYDMQVSDTTVDAWDQTLKNATGTALGDGFGSSVGSGTGQGFGAGHGRLGGNHATVTPQMTPHSWISDRVRFDSAGKAHFRVPLGPIETKWGIGVLADADTGEAAASSIAVPVALPLSVRVESGGQWTEGDRASARILVRNRTAALVHATVLVSAKDGVALATNETTFSVDVPAGGLVGHAVALRAVAAGEASLSASVTAPALEGDSVEATWPVLVAGEALTTARSVWVSTASELTAEVPATNRLTGRASLVIERGVRRTVDLALTSLDPDRLGSPRDLLASVEAATRVLRWATANEPEGSPRRARAKDVLDRARARLLLIQSKINVDDVQRLITRRLELVAPAPITVVNPAKPSVAEDKCPNSNYRLKEDDVVASEPAPEATGSLPCWDSFVSEAVRHATSNGSAAELARLYLLLVDRSHRAPQAKALFSELLRVTHPDETGAAEIKSSARVDRAIVYAALVRGGRDAGDAAKQSKLLGWLLVNRDAGGSFGNALVTREAIDALVSLDVRSAAPSDVRVRAHGVVRDLRIDGDDVVTIPLEAGELHASVEVRGAPIFATLVRPLLRPFGIPGELVASPLAVSVTWPTDAAVGKNLLVHVDLAETTYEHGPIQMRARIPLPPGVTLAAPVAGVKQIGGALIVQVDLTAKLALDIPIRFGLSGTMSTREPQAFAPVLGVPRAVGPAQTIVVK